MINQDDLSLQEAERFNALLSKINETGIELCELFQEATDQTAARALAHLMIIYFGDRFDCRYVIEAEAFLRTLSDKVREERIEDLKTNDEWPTVIDDN